MQSNYRTERLSLTELDLGDAAFITALVNTPAWIQFIGDRNIRTLGNARAYIQKIKGDPTIIYWVVRLAREQTPIGIITFIKRDYLTHHDIGFAFLSEFANNGYAFEAATAVLTDVIHDPSHTHVLATTLPENAKSIKLLGKLGFTFKNEIQQGNDSLLIYAISIDTLFITHITNSFYRAFTNANKQVPDLEKIHAVCLPEAVFIKKENEAEQIFDLTSFIEPRKRILSDGTLTEFEEYQVSEETKVIGNMAQRFSAYKKKGYLNGAYFEARGNKLFQYVKTTTSWKIAAVMWEDEKAA